MATQKNWRYVRDYGPEKLSKWPCPVCKGKKRKVRGWIEAATGERLPQIFGECDKPGCYRLSPYDPQANGVSYAEEVYLRGKEEARNNPNYKPVRRMLPPPAPKPIVAIPAEIVAQSQRGYEHNTFVQLLRSRFGYGVADELVKTFAVGSSSFWPGSTVFWQFDELGQARGAQVVKFREDGHRDKYVDDEGQERPKMNWIQWAMKSACKKRGQPTPTWLQDFIDAGVSSPCLFGLQQLATAPAEKTWAIVESPKTAIVGTGFMPEFVWAATGTLSQLTIDRLLPIRSRKIHLFPDCSPDGLAFAKWQARADELNAQGFNITVSDYEQTHATPQQRADKWDIADFILEKWEGFPPNWRVM